MTANTHLCLALIGGIAAKGASEAENFGKSHQVIPTWYLLARNGVKWRLRKLMFALKINLFPKSVAKPAGAFSLEREWKAEPDL